MIGKIAIDNLYLAQTDKDQALIQFVQALSGLLGGVLQPAAFDAVRFCRRAHDPLGNYGSPGAEILRCARNDGVEECAQHDKANE